MSKVFVVFGTTGEYSDRDEWPVAAYADEALAKAHAEAAKRWYHEHNVYAHLYNYEKTFANPFDPNMRCDYTGTDWSISEVPLRTALPEE